MQHGTNHEAKRNPSEDPENLLVEESELQVSKRQGNIAQVSSYLYILPACDSSDISKSQDDNSNYERSEDPEDLLVDKSELQVSKRQGNIV